MGIRVWTGLLVVVSNVFGESPDANKIFSTIRDNNTAELGALLADKANANVRGARDVTPLLYASAYGSIQAMKMLLKAGAKVNAANALGATPLMWSVSQPDKVKLLLDRGADVNAKTKNGRTALIIAAQDPGSDRVVDLLLAKGADIKATAGDGANFLLAAGFGFNPREVRIALDRGIDINSRDMFGMTALMYAASNGDAESVKLLIGKGADVNAVAAPAGVQKVKNGDIQLGSFTALMMACSYGPPSIVEALLHAGAKVDGTDARGMTPLHYAVTTHYQNPEIVRMLLKAGAKPEVKMSHGGDASDWAARFGVPDVTAQLPKGESAVVEPVSAVTRTPQAAVNRSLQLLTNVSTKFINTGGCVSCHAQSIAGFAVGTATKHGFHGGDSAASDLLAAGKGRWQSMPDRLLAREDPEGGAEELDYALLHFAAAGYQASTLTDPMVLNLVAQQMPDGSLHAGGIARPPISDGDLTHTALAMRAMQVFSWPGRKADIDAHIERARRWLAAAPAVTTDDFAFKTLGLKWAGDSRANAAARQLAARQRDDGGWAQNAYLPSDAYATGQAVYALIESGAFHPGDAVVRRGVQYLLATQHEDGSWRVRSRAPKFQPYFQSGFPHDHDQWISMMGTAWAAAALADAAEPERSASLRPAGASQVR